MKLRFDIVYTFQLRFINAIPRFNHPQDIIFFENADSIVRKRFEFALSLIKI